MATVVNNPGTTQEGNGFGFLLGVLLLIIFAVIVLFYGIPYMTPQVQVPEKVDVNVNQQPK